jgi:hypothetical protein
MIEKASIKTARQLVQNFADLEWHERKILREDRHNEIMYAHLQHLLKRQLYDAADEGKREMVYLIPLTLGHKDSDVVKTFLKQILEMLDEFDVSVNSFKNQHSLTIRW